MWQVWAAGASLGLPAWESLGRGSQPLAVLVLCWLKLMAVAVGFRAFLGAGRGDGADFWVVAMDVESCLQLAWLPLQGVPSSAVGACMLLCPGDAGGVVLPKSMAQRLWLC